VIDLFDVMVAIVVSLLATTASVAPLWVAIVRDDGARRRGTSPIVVTPLPRAVARDRRWRS
jgi:hypothetical protein